MQTFKYSDRHKLFPNVRIISHNTSWGGSFKDHRYWMSEFNGEVDDYATKNQLIADAIKHNLPYVVLRIHRNGNATNIARSGQVAGTGKSDGDSTSAATCH